MNGNGRNGASVSPNIDTTIKEIRFKRRDKKTFARKINSLATDEQQGVVERIITEVIEDCRGRPVLRNEDVMGFCSRCERAITVGDEVECESARRCATGLLCRFCWRKEGAHELNGLRYCQRDYGWAWLGDLFAWIFGLRRRQAATENAQPVRETMPVVRRVLVADPRMMQEVQGDGFPRRRFPQAALEQSGTTPREAGGRVRTAWRQI